MGQFKKRRIKTTRIFILLLTTALFAMALPAVAGENLLENPGFEEPRAAGDPDNTPLGWWSWNSDYNDATTKTTRTGKQAVYFTKPPLEAAQHQGIVFTYKGAKQGKEYAFSCYVKNSKKDPIKGKAYGQLSIEWRKKGKEINRTWGPCWRTDLSSKDWKLINMSTVAPQGVDECFFVVNFFTKNGSGAYFADDISAVEK